jgi:hypothetical protein
MTKFIPLSISSFTILGLMTSQGISQSQVIQRRSQQNCSPIARVLGWALPRFVCAEDLVSPQSGQALQMICFGNSNLVSTKEIQRVSQICSQPPLNHRQVCSTQQTKPCYLTRSGTERGVVNLMYPVGIVHQQTQPWLRWQPVTGATSYQISWQWQGKSLAVYQTQSTQFRSQIPLKLGETYRLQITALANNVPVATIVRPYNLISKSDHKHLRQLLSEVEGTAPATTLAARELQAIYLHFGLVGDAVASLNKFALSTKYPIYHRLLGERYLELGELNTAQVHYQAALRLAAQNSEEEKRIRQGLQDIIVIQSQLPKSTQPPQ